MRIQAKVFIMKTVTSTPQPSDEAKDSSNGDSASVAPSDSLASTGEVKQDKWVDVGMGELHINTYKVGEMRKGRLIMRADRTHRLILNTPILPHLDMSFVVHEQRYVRLASVNAEEGGKLQQLLLKVKGKVEAQEIVDTLKKVVAMIDK
jgi:hypothetical protein